MTTKQRNGLQAPDGSQYVTLTDGSGNLSASGANANGQATMANSAPVAIASDQSTLPVIGTIADGAAAGNSLSMVVEGRTTNKTAVTTGQMVRPVGTSVGAQVNKPFQVPELDWSFASAGSGILNTTTAVTLTTAAGSGIRNYITSMQIMSEALTTATELAIRDGAAGTVIWRTKIGTGGLTTGLNVIFLSPLKSTANTLLEVVTLTASGAGAVYVNAQGYKAP